MADEKTGSANDPKDIADKSIEAGIADEGAAYEQAISKTDTRDAPPSLDEGDPKTTNDGSGTSETD